MSEKRIPGVHPGAEAEIVLAGLRGDRSVRDVCREHGIAETLYYQWRDRLLEGGKAASGHDREIERRSGEPSSCVMRRSASGS